MIGNDCVLVGGFVILKFIIICNGDDIDRYLQNFQLILKVYKIFMFLWYEFVSFGFLDIIGIYFF